MIEKDGRFIFGWYENEPIYLTTPSDNDLTCDGCAHSYKPNSMYPCYRCTSYRRLLQERRKVK